MSAMRAGEAPSSGMWVTKSLAGDSKSLTILTKSVAAILLNCKSYSFFSDKNGSILHILLLARSLTP